MSDDRQLDDLLERGLRAYSEAEPRAGLEERILANLRTQPEKRPWWRVWVPVLAAAAVIAIVAALALRPDRTAAPHPTIATNPPAQSAPQPKPSLAQVPNPPPAPRAVAVRRRPAPSRHETAVAQVPALPRQATFPAPSPLTEQERLVLSLMRRAPDEAVQLAQTQETQRARAEYYLRTGEFPEQSATEEKNPQ